MPVLLSWDYRLSVCVEQFFCLVFRFAGEVYAEVFEQLFIHLRKQNGGMHLAAGKAFQAIQRRAGVFVAHRTDRKRYKHLIGVEARIVVAQETGFEPLYRFDDRRGHKKNIVVDIRKAFKRIQQHCARSAEQGACLAGDYPAVRQVDCGGGSSGRFRLFVGGTDDRAILRRNAALVHEYFGFVYGGIAAHSLSLLAERFVIAADNLLLCRLAADFVIGYRRFDHVHAHVRGGFIRGGAVYFFENRIEHREYFDIAVVIHRLYAVCFKVERVYAVDIVQIGGRRLICYVYGVFKRKIPDREGFELRIPRLYAVHMLVIELGKAGRHFAAAGAGSRDDNEPARGFYVIVSAQALFAYDKLDVGGVSLDGIMLVRRHAELFEPLFECDGGGLGIILRKHDAADIKPRGAECVDKPKNVLIVGYAEIPADLVFFDIVAVDDNDDLRLVPQLRKHGDLYPRLEPGKHAGCVIIIEKLAAEFDIKLIAEPLEPFADMRRLKRDVPVAVKADLFHIFPLCFPPQNAELLLFENRFFK